MGAPTSREIRAQVLEQIIEVMLEANKAGRDEQASAQECFPGTPENVLWEAYGQLLSRLEEDWWRAVERTIDGEIIRNALAKNGSLAGINQELPF